MAEQCPECKAPDMTRVKRDHHFIECGLKNVTLTDWDGHYCDQCGTYRPIGPPREERTKVLVKAILTKPSLLRGDEILFLRNAADKQGEEFATLVRMNSTRLSRIERDCEFATDDEDRKIRLIVGTKFLSQLGNSTLKKIMSVLRGETGNRMSKEEFHINLHQKINPEKYEVDYTTYYMTDAIE